MLILKKIFLDSEILIFHSRKIEKWPYRVKIAQTYLAMLWKYWDAHRKHHTTRNSSLKSKWLMSSPVSSRFLRVSPPLPCVRKRSVFDLSGGGKGARPSSQFFPLFILRRAAVSESYTELDRVVSFLSKRKILNILRRTYNYIPGTQRVTSTCALAKDGLSLMNARSFSRI